MSSSDGNYVTFAQPTNRRSSDNDRIKEQVLIQMHPFLKVQVVKALDIAPQGPRSRRGVALCSIEWRFERIRRRYAAVQKQLEPSGKLSTWA
jgi:hypothetical protein